MTDTGQIPAEGLPEHAGTVEQPGVPAPAAYAYLSESPAEDEDLLLPGAQGAWGNEVAPPAPEPVVEAVHRPDPQESAAVGAGGPPGVGPGGAPVEIPGGAPVVVGGTPVTVGGTPAGGTPVPGGGSVPGGVPVSGGASVSGSAPAPGGAPASGGVSASAGGSVSGGATAPGGAPVLDGAAVPGGTPAGGTPVPGGTSARGMSVSAGTSAGSTSVPGGTPPGGTPVPGSTPAGGTAVPGGTPAGGTPVSAGTPAGGTPVPGGTPAGGTPVPGGTPAGGTPVSGAVPVGATPAGGTPVAPRSRPLHLGPPMPDASASPVRSLADRGPAGVPARAPAPASTGPEYLDVPRHREAAPQSAAPWGPAPASVRTAPAPVAPPAPEPPATIPAPTAPNPAETVGPTAVAPEAAPAEPEPTVEPVAPEAVAEPVTEPAAEPIAEPAAEPIAEPVAEQSAPLVQQPLPADAGAAAATVKPPQAPPAAEQPQPAPLPVPPQPVAEAPPTPEAIPEATPEPTQVTSVAPEVTPAAQPPQPVAEFVPVEGQVPTTPHLAPTPPHTLPVPPVFEPPAPPEPFAVVPPPREAEQPDAGLVQQAEDLETRTADQDEPPAPEPQPEPEPIEAPPAEPLAEAPEAPPAPPAAPETTPVPPATPETPEAPDAPAEEPQAAAEAPPVTDEPQLTHPAPEPPEPTPLPEPTEPDTAPAPISPPAPAYEDAEREAVLKVMRERRDIRNGFRSDPIPHEVLLRVLEAAHTAPSVGHSQPWDFVVIRSTETRRAMHDLATRQRDAYAKSLPKGRAKQFKELKIEAILDTPVNIVVTADPTRGGRHTLGRHTQPQMAPYSSALAVENLWLAARAEGLGVGWVSFFDEREMVRALGLPEHLEVVAYLCVGYVDEFPDEPELAQAGWSRRRPLSWVVHEETYGRRALPGEEPHDLLGETVAQIRPLDAKALGEAWERQKRMTKPAGALGMLEIISAQLAGLSRQCPPPIPEPAAVAVFAGDHGVHAQGVTPWPQEVTAQMVANFLGGGAVCNAFATQVGAEVCVVDVGVASDLPATPGLLPRKIRAGTSDMTTGPAMTREEAKAAIEVGIETARDLVAAGNKALLTGEMGIANTTASAALISVFTATDPAEVTGRGTGINDETLARKTEVVRRAIELHRPDPADPIGVLAAIGGLEHAAMVGLLLGGASLRTPVILDGVSAGAAALVARAIAPEVLAACIAGHRSAEPGHVAALTKLGLRPLVDLDLRLGEGTGALLALPMVQSTARAMHEVATFDSAGVTEK
ncbi:nicotinate-nucleotide--dimethylbenzimidazole phosphoribosyltransferase [Streptomyces sp. NPDC093252]|uniref:nicotinate-nucleotide--dimethylbenzimidazole phosphoribosyltransferase n=1 Tax=Streptomyces sp. NPDC093252 TaxID=3154980 RepID=UPI003439F3E1